MAEVDLAADVRPAKGSANSRRLRADGKIPGVLYGHGIDSTPLAVNARSLRQALSTEAGLNALIRLDLGGKKHLALPRDIQRHPVRNTVAHIDFQLVRRDEVMTVEVPLNFIGEAEGVTKQGGVVENLLQSLTVQATPSNIPGHLDVDISGLELDGSIRVKDIELPNGVTTGLDDEEPVVIGKTSSVAAEVEEAAEAADAAAQPAEAAEAGESAGATGDTQEG